MTVTGLNYIIGVNSITTVTPVSFDVDAQAFITAANITDDTQQNAINSLVVSAKANGWWSLCYAIYPFVGGSNTKHSYNLRNPALYQLTYSNTPTSNAIGIELGASDADTGLNVNSVLSLGDSHLSLYTHNDLAEDTQGDLFAYDGTYIYGVSILLTTTISIGYISDQFLPIDSWGGGVGNSTLGLTTLMFKPVGLEWFRNGVSSSVENTPIQSFLPSSNLRFNNQENTSKIYQFATIGRQLTPTQEADKYADIHEFRLALMDTDAQAFLAATSITDMMISNAINELVINAKTNGWWDKCSAIYPMVGGTAGTHKYNLKNPQDTDGAFRLSFNGGWTHSANGAIPDGISGTYADTHLNASTVLSQDDTHISFYSRTNSTGAKVDIGLENSPFTSGLLMYVRLSDSFYAYVNDTTGGVISNTNSQGHYICSRLSSGTVDGYRNGSSVISSPATSTSLANLNLYIGADNLNSVDSVNSDRQCAFATIGEGVDATMAGNMYNDIQEFQTTLNRQV